MRSKLARPCTEYFQILQAGQRLISWTSDGTNTGICRAAVWLFYVSVWCCTLHKPHNSFNFILGYKIGHRIDGPLRALSMIASIKNIQVSTRVPVGNFSREGGANIYVERLSRESGGCGIPASYRRVEENFLNLLLKERNFTHVFI